MSTLMEIEMQRKGEHALTLVANRIKALGDRMRGATIQIAWVEIGETRLFIAGINSSAGFNDRQRDELKRLGILEVPCHLKGVRREDGGAPHAEENMAAYIHDRGGRGLRWSRAVVGGVFDTRRGSQSYVCAACRAMVERVGGVIEPPF
ncbi:hypothetical protein VSR68_21695 [Paraburkholderia phymatum]|uniref:hypothetical protein n=1 Tax=Paraburkholderia phymatum TaxID=148447 RepID=UPI00316C226E